MQTLLSREAQAWLARGAIRRLGYDTYERETERYGGDVTIPHCETLFYCDTEAAVDLIRLADWGDGGGER